MEEGGGGEEKGILSFTSLPFSLPFFPFSPETPDTQAMGSTNVSCQLNLRLFVSCQLNDH